MLTPVDKLSRIDRAIRRIADVVDHDGVNERQIKQVLREEGVLPSEAGLVREAARILWRDRFFDRNPVMKEIWETRLPPALYIPLEEWEKRRTRKSE